MDIQVVLFLFLFWSYIQNCKKTFLIIVFPQKLTVYVRETARHVSTCRIVERIPSPFCNSIYRHRRYIHHIILLSKLVLVRRFVSSVNNLLRNIYFIVILLYYFVILYYCCIIVMLHLFNYLLNINIVHNYLKNNLFYFLFVYWIGIINLY